MTNTQYIRYLLFKDREVNWYGVGICVLVLLGIITHVVALITDIGYYNGNLLAISSLTVNIAGFVITFVLPVSFKYKKGTANSVNLSHKVLIECYGNERFLEKLSEVSQFKQDSNIVYVKYEYAIYGYFINESIKLKSEVEKEIGGGNVG